MSSSSSEGCGGAVCRCLASIPCSVVCLCLASFGAILACGGSLVVSFYRTRSVLNTPDLWPYYLYVCLGVGVGMLVLVTVFLVVATLSTKNTAVRLFNTRRKMRCIRAFNCVVIILMVLVQFAWLLITVGLSIVVLDLLLVDNLGSRGPKCVNLAHYGIPRLPKQMVCDAELPQFLEQLQKEELLICYSVSLASSVVVVVTMALFMINAAANYAHLGNVQPRSTPRPGGGSTGLTSSAGHVPMGGYPSYDGPRMMATETTM